MTGIDALLGAMCILLAIKVIILEHDHSNLSEFTMFIAEDQKRLHDHISTLYDHMISSEKESGVL